MTEIGYYSLLFAFFISAYSGLVSFIGARANRGDMLDSSRKAALAVFGLLTLAVAALIYALVTRDFSLAYVTKYTSGTLPMIYTVAAFYAGQAGSLLFWGWLLAAFSVLVLFQNRRQNRELLPYVLSVMMTLTFFLYC